MRHSRQRDIIVEILKSSYDHPTADVIYQRAREIEPSISLGTVYRNIAKLCLSGDIVSIESEGKSIRYDGRTSKHQHFICKECGKVIDVFSEMSVPEELKNCEISETKCVYYGICEDCVIKIKN